MLFRINSRFFKMSKTSIFLLMAMITGFAFFQTATAGIPITCISIPDTSSCVVDTLCLLQDSPTQTILPTTDPPEQTRKKRIIAALCALPFPCGFVGAHRVMLGSSPWVPVVYVATFGGCFGLLPLIDFCFITFSKDITPFENNPHVFMWIKQ